MEGRRKFSLPKHLQGIPLYPSLMVSRTSLSVWSSHKNNPISISLKVIASNIKILYLASLKCLPSLCLYLGAYLKWTSAFQPPLLAPPHLLTHWYSFEGFKVSPQWWRKVWRKWLSGMRLGEVLPGGLQWYTVPLMLLQTPWSSSTGDLQRQVTHPEQGYFSNWLLTTNLGFLWSPCPFSESFSQDPFQSDLWSIPFSMIQM